MNFHNRIAPRKSFHLEHSMAVSLRVAIPRARYLAAVCLPCTKLHFLFFRSRCTHTYYLINPFAMWISTFIYDFSLAFSPLSFGFSSNEVYEYTLYICEQFFFLSHLFRSSFTHSKSVCTWTSRQINLITRFAHTTKTDGKSSSQRG